MQGPGEGGRERGREGGGREGGGRGEGEGKTGGRHGGGRLVVIPGVRYTHRLPSLDHHPKCGPRVEWARKELYTYMILRLSGYRRCVNR